MKKTYTVPATQVIKIRVQSIIANSNGIDGNSINLNPNTMDEGDGVDAARSDNFWGSAMWE